ncbi:DNA-directed RNA polymerase subunit RPC12/RpoP [Nocardiopsis mwathae]|uniref:DNA-directed RNA polymerase subunit RPC12/RpoP n=1 Tax=Nocardiopsis mwathae TaxID=1472723 RepID=A0A7X0D5P8_9ACTN|nr:hypothetical protein [Nocardiopsis mwathae]MBB6171876.1 DNA-directed RNA polymerase subunit RPC12/RpoP [Nocardiopsis mwathae]
MAKSTWWCPRCDFYNNLDRGTCLNCGAAHRGPHTREPATAPAPPGAPPSASDTRMREAPPPATAWRCLTCASGNDAQDPSCRYCGSRRAHGPAPRDPRWALNVPPGHGPGRQRAPGDSGDLLAGAAVPAAPPTGPTGPDPAGHPRDTAAPGPGRRGAATGTAHGPDEPEHAESGRGRHARCASVLGALRHGRLGRRATSAGLLGLLVPPVVLLLLYGCGHDPDDAPGLGAGAPGAGIPDPGADPGAGHGEGPAASAPQDSDCPFHVTRRLPEPEEAVLVEAFMSADKQITLCRTASGSLFYYGEYFAEPENGTLVPAETTDDGYTAESGPYRYEIVGDEVIVFRQGEELSRDLLMPLAPPGSTPPGTGSDHSVTS